MKIVDLTCTHCGANLKVDADSKEVTCEFCGTKMMIDDEIQHTQIDNAEEAGYQFEKGRQRAKEEAGHESNNQYITQPQKQKKKNMVWWVLGWIFIFPLPLTLILVRTNKVAKWLKIIIIIIAWLVYGLLVLSGILGSNDSDSRTSTNKSVEETVVADNKETHIDNFVDKFNEKSSVQLVFNEYFTPKEEDNGHYRHEFHAIGFTNTFGKSYKYNDLTVDFVSFDDSKPNFRFYVPFENIDQIIDIVKISLPILDETITDEAVQKLIDEAIRVPLNNGDYIGKNNNIFVSILHNELFIKCGLN